MSFTNETLKRKKVLLFVLIALTVGGVFAFQNMSKLEDPEISVKQALVITQYPGASPHEVELQVTNKLENAIQTMANVDFITSRSMAGYSEISVAVKQSVLNKDLPQFWDVLRRKVNDATPLLPQGAHTPMVLDDFGDVYGIFLAMDGDSYSYEELRKYSQFLQRELLLVKGVKRINLFGEQMECVDIQLSQEKMGHLGINPLLVVKLLSEQNKVVNPGALKVGSKRVRIAMHGNFHHIDDIKNLLVSTPGVAPVYLKDIATVKHSYYEPFQTKLKYNEKPAIGLAIAMASGGNVLKLGERVQKRLLELKQDIPAGININEVFYQPKRVNIAINQFMINLIESVLIVVLVLLLTMGFRTGLLIGSGLIFTILGTFIVMLGTDIALQRVSLGAIIIAMGMLVDNAIVVADGILVDLKRGVARKKAMVNTANQTAMPLLGATLVAILAFLPIFLSPDATGEFCQSLFQVLAISLLLSWILALTQTPYFCDLFLRGKKYQPKNSDNSQETDPYGGKVYQKFRQLVTYSLRHKLIIMGVITILFISSVFVFQYVKKMFFPSLEYNQFIVEYWMPEGTDIQKVEKDLSEIATYVSEQKGVKNITTSLGSTPARYTLVRPFITQKQNYGELIIDTDNFEQAKQLKAHLQGYLDDNYPQANARVLFYAAIFTEYQIEANFTGPDPAVLRQLTAKAEDIMRNEPLVGKVTNDWKNKVPVWTPRFSQVYSRLTNITRADVANALASATNGLPIGVLNEDEEKLPILLKTTTDVKHQIAQIENTPVWGQTYSSVPLGQVVEKIDVEFKDNVVCRYNRRRAMKAQCDPKEGYNAPEVFEKLHKKIEAIPLPDGYQLEWLGEYKQNNQANENMAKFLPLAIFLMIIIVLLLFNNFRQPIIIFMILPLAFIGVSYGLWLTGVAFNFMAVLGTLGLMGMMIKNSVVLLDQINVELSKGVAPLTAVINSSVSRMRPVLMASLTTILGMLPLITDATFSGMAVAIMFGLFVGSIITLIVVPVLYTLFYRIETK